MEDDDNAALSVGFNIDFHDAQGQLRSLDDMIGKTAADVVRQFQRIEAATKGAIDLGGATARITAFGNATTLAEQNIRREKAKTEKQIEGYILALDRETAAVGRSRIEQRAARMEAAAAAATQQGNTEVVARLRASQTALAAAQTAAADKAAAAKARESQAVRDAAFAYDQFEKAARNGMAALREQQARDQAIQREANAVRERAAAERAVNVQLMERSRIEAALERTTGVGRVRATDAGATFSALSAQAAENEARAVREAAFAHQLFETRAREGMAALREHEAATQRDAAALANLRAMIDPAAAAQDRLNNELAEARRVMKAAGASADELARAEDALWARSQRSTQQHRDMAGAARGNAFALQQVAIQMPDVVQGLLTGQKPMTVFIQQGGQIVQIAMMAEGGLRGLGKELGLIALRFAPLLAVLAAAGAGFALFARWINEGVTNDQLTRDLGKITGGADATKQELFKLREETVSWGAISQALFKEVGKDIAEQFVGDMKTMSKDTKAALDDLTSYGKAALAGMYAGVAGMRAYLGELEKGGIKGIAKMAIGQGDPALLDRTFGASYRAADTYLTKLGARVRKTAVEITREDLAKKIGFNNAPKAKVDGHAAALARDAEAVEAQIRNLYALADAYGVSGAEALIAEARVKAESKAIRQRGDIEAAVAREVRLSVAQRVSDAAKTTASMRDQADLQAKMNAEVAAGNLPAERASEMLRDRLADLPLLAAIEAAQRVRNADGADRATKALDAQRAARERLTDEERKAARLAATATGNERLAELREELSLIGATDIARAKALAILRATQQAARMDWTGPDAAAWIEQQGQIAVETERLAQAQYLYNDALTFTADKWDLIARNVQDAGRGMADAFGAAGQAIGDVASTYANYQADRQRRELTLQDQINKAGKDQAGIDRANARFAIASQTAQIGLYGDLAQSARGFFKEGSTGYKAMGEAVKVFRAVEFALSVKSIAQDAIETGTKLAKSAARTAANAVEAVTKAIASLPFPANIAAGAATIAALAAVGVSVVGAISGGGKNTLPKANDGTGTVLGDTSAKSESIRRSIDALKEVDTLTLNTSREMLSSLRAIETSIGGVASLVVRAGNVNADVKVNEGFQKNLIGSVLSKIPLVGGILGGLFGSKTDVIGGGLYGGAQSLGGILERGFDAAYYSDTKKTSKFLGITTGTKYSTSYTGADAGLEGQFTLLLRQFNDAITAAAGPLGTATGEIEARLRSMVINIGKIDLKGLTGAEIEEKLSAVFGAAADQMAAAAIPGLDRFQKVGEGAFETLVRVASTVESVTAALDQLSMGARALGIDAKMGIAAQFESISAMSSAVQAYADAFYTQEEQSAAKQARLASVFASLNMVMPGTLAAFRQLVDAQDLTTTAGQSTYATLIQLAPAFAELKAAMDGAKSAADILAERQDLERKLLELRGDTAALRALDLAKLDASNRALQEQVWAVQDAMEAAKAADELRQAWSSVGDTIMEEVRRIRGLAGTDTGGGFAVLMGRFNAATTAAQAGDQDAAKSLPGLSQALLTAAAQAASSRQELDRVQAQTAASLEATYAAIQAFSKATAPAAATDALLASAATTQAAATPAAANDDLAAEIAALREELAAMRQDNNAGHAATASQAGRAGKVLERVSDASGGEAIAVANAA